MKQILFLFAAALLLGTLGNAQPASITWQGKLLDNSGNAITQNDMAMNFAMFDASTGGNQLWPASGVVTKIVDVVQGLYSLRLGTGVGDDIAFTAAMFAGKTPWLEVKVGTETLPRTEITNVPFALISNELSAPGWENPGEIGKTTPNTGIFTTLETGSVKVTTGASIGKVLTSDAEGNASWQNARLVNFVESNYLFNTKTGVKLQPDNPASDVDLVLSPKGSGAFLIQQPDGAVTGGNNRGILTVDLQRIRFSADRVASGDYSFIGGGYNNAAAGSYATVIGGYNNTASHYLSTISGGSSNTASSNYATIGGGNANVASGFASCVNGGYFNNATANFSAASGGVGNIASGKSSFVVGELNTAQSWGETTMGLYSTLAGGNPSSFVATDRLLAVGNGQNESARSDAFTILKNGNATIGGSLTLNGNGTNLSITFPTGRGTNGQVLNTNGDGTTDWASSGSLETDPVFMASPAAGITATQISNWDESYSWGDHAGLYRPVSWVPSWNDITGKPFRIENPIFGDLLMYDQGIDRWINWTPNFLTSENDPVVKAVSGLVKSNGSVISAAIAGNDYLAPGQAVTGVSGTAPIVSSGGTTPAISITAATVSEAGSMSAEDKIKLNGLDGSETRITSGTNISVTGTGTSGSPYVINTAPTVTKSERNALTPVEGMIVYNLTTHKPNYYNGTEWMNYDGTVAMDIGDSYQGGVIAYFLQAGDPGYDASVPHGLIAAPTDQSTGIQWYNGSYTITGATATAIGTGNTNTNTIVTSQGAGSYAAQLCYDLVLGGYSDWYLPSNDELRKLYINRTAIGGFSTGLTGFYWSSSELSDQGAYSFYFYNGANGSRNKLSTDYVRAVRSF